MNRFETAVLRRRFTLIEMLIVVVIVLILASMLLPALETARERARVIACSANMKNLHTANMLYLSTFDRLYADAFEWVDAPAGASIMWRDTWRVENGLLFEFVGSSKEVYVCPSAANWYPKATGNTAAVAFNYSMNAYFGSANGWRGYKVKRPTQVESPSTLVMLGEENAWTYSPYTNYGMNNAALGVGAWPSGATDGFASYHLVNYENWMFGGKGVVAYTDGHVTLEHVSDSVRLSTPQALQ